MRSLEKLAKQGRFDSALDLGVFSLIIVGFMATTASAFWTFTTRGANNPPALERASVADPLVCECTIEIQPACADEIEQPDFQAKAARF